MSDIDPDDDAPDDATADDDPDEGRADDEGAYVCGSCGESVVIPLDPSAGRHQRYVEDCPVCCAPNEISVEFDEGGGARVTARAEGG